MYELKGAYRLHNPEDIHRMTSLASEAFPEFGDRIKCFASDWLGRQFASDSERIVDGEPQILMLEPGTGEVLEIPFGYAAFHSVGLSEFSDALLASNFYEDWLASGGSPPDDMQCVGYVRPLFLNGSDDLANLAVQDFDVYWSICGQLLAQVRNSPAVRSPDGLA